MERMPDEKRIKDGMNEVENGRGSGREMAEKLGMRETGTGAGTGHGKAGKVWGAR
jgi:hypothetical protein